MLRRRIAVVGALVAVVVVAAVAVASSGGGGGGSSSPQRSANRGHGHSGSAHPAAAHPAGGGSTAAALGSASGPPGHATVPILMYHVIAAPPAGAPFPGLYVQPQEFAAQMQALKAAGWHAVTLDQLRASWTRGARLPAGKPIVITFDNGSHSQYISALPVLHHMGWAADENIQLSGLPPSQGGLTEAEVQGMVNAGWELDTQGISHADLISARRLAAALPGGGRTPAPAAPLPRARQLVLLPVGSLQLHGHRRRPRSRVRGLHDRGPGLGGTLQRCLPPPSPARPRWHEPVGTAGADRLHAHGVGSPHLLRRGVRPSP